MFRVPLFKSLAPLRSTGVPLASARQYATKLASDATTPKTASICLEGTVLTGMAYLKDQKPVVAMADEEYPPWLWTLLKPKKKDLIVKEGTKGVGDAAAQKALRSANRKNIRNSNFMKTQ